MDGEHRSTHFGAAMELVLFQRASILEHVAVVEFTHYGKTEQNNVTKQQHLLFQVSSHFQSWAIRCTLKAMTPPCM